MKKDNAIDYKKVEYIKNIIHPDVKIMDVYLLGKWVVAVLSSNMRFMVKNN